jgi:hypothetical protein
MIRKINLGLVEENTRLYNALVEFISRLETDRTEAMLFHRQ